MPPSNGKMNKGLAEYKQAQREATLRRIDKAIQYFRDNGLEIAKKNIAIELNMH